jgi:hypothetical protein
LIPRFAFEECENSVDGGDESQVVERAVVALSVDEEGRGAVDSAADAAGEIGADALGKLPTVESVGEGDRINAKLDGEFLVELRSKAVLIFEEEVVHLPEFSLALFF